MVSAEFREFNVKTDCACTVKAMISGASETKGLPDILISRVLLGYLRANVYLSAPVNLMDRRKHLIFRFVS